MTTKTRSIIHRTRGSQHGFIRRMVSPGDLGEAIKPFIFLDYIRGRVAPGTGFGWHPHSGIATLTYSLNSDVAYEDTTGQKGMVEATGLEWMRAGGGTWHQATIHPREEIVTSFQLWVALPKGVEDGAFEGIYVSPDQVPQIENVRVLLGAYGDRVNPIPAPSPITYLDVTLNAGDTWTYAPPSGHTVAWAFVYQGSARVDGVAVAGELVVFEEGMGAIDFEANEASRILFGSAAKHPHPLVLGTYSVHTNAASLAQGEATIRAEGAKLRSAGKL